jgi:hypothetical protein
MEFQGAGTPLSASGLAKGFDLLTVGPAEVWAVLTVETGTCGFLGDRRPSILFEQHIFHQQTGGKFDSTAPDISNKTPGNYGARGGHQYDRLMRAAALDRKSALLSASWGIGQVMGFNTGIAGYADVESLVKAMSESEDNQLLATANEIKSNNLDGALRSHDWADFARGYNGPNYKINKYDLRLAAGYAKYATGLLPDLDVRAAQLYLTYLGYAPGPIDGVAGRFTQSALQQFQLKSGIQVTGQVDIDVLNALRAAIV